jgi:hypothetical protein
MMRRMRSSVLANPFVAAVAALIATGALGCNSCSGCREKEKAAGSDDGSDESGGGEDDPSAAGGGFGGPQQMPRGAGPAGGRKDFIPITTEEVKALIPPLTGASYLKEPTAVAGGRRISVHQCVSGNELDKVKVEVEQFLGNQGFKVTPSGRPRKNWHIIRADKDNMRVSATMRMAEYPDCKESEKKTKVILTYFKLMPKRPPKTQPVPGQPPGAPGAGQPGQAGQPPAQPGGAAPTPPSQPPAQPKNTVDAGPG